MGFGKAAAKGEVLTMTTSANAAKTLVFWFSVVFLGYMLWRLLAMPPNPWINHPIRASIGISPLVLVCGFGLWISGRRQTRQKQ
jgi:hypothetical protein